MISSFAYPGAQTMAQPAEGVPAISGLNPYQQRGIPAAFRLADDGSKTDDKEEEKGEFAESDERKQLPPGTSDMFRLLMNPEFQELVDFFLTPDHQTLVYMRAAIRAEKQLSDQNLYRCDLIPDEKIDLIREQLYRHALDFFSKSPHAPLLTVEQGVLIKSR